METRRDEVVEFSNNTIMLGLVGFVTCWVPGANFTKVFRVGFAKVR